MKYLPCYGGTQISSPGMLIHRNLDMIGDIKDFPKTDAGQRSIPMVVREAMLAWEGAMRAGKGLQTGFFPALAINIAILWNRHGRAAL